MRDEKYYIAYGSNLHVAQMQHRCPGAVAVGAGVLEGWRLAFRGSKTGAYLTIEPDKRTSVPVGIWRITPEHEAALDRYEGYPVFYRKDYLAVRCRPLRTDGPEVKLTGLVYIMTPGHPTGVPASWYIKTCTVGCACFGLDPDPILRAARRTRLLARKEATA